MTGTYDQTTAEFLMEVVDAYMKFQSIEQKHTDRVKNKSIRRLESSSHLWWVPSKVGLDLRQGYTKLAKT